jgi:hypothetical protein
MATTATVTMQTVWANRITGHADVDYRRFKRTKLRLKPGIVIPDEPNEYGMKLASLAARTEAA